METELEAITPEDDDPLALIGEEADPPEEAGRLPDDEEDENEEMTT